MPFIPRSTMRGASTKNATSPSTTTSSTDRTDQRSQRRLMRGMCARYLRAGGSRVSARPCRSSSRWLHGLMSEPTEQTAQDETKLVSASREIHADAATIFELIADPAQQPRWDGNDNLAEAPTGQRVRA